MYFPELWLFILAGGHVLAVVLIIAASIFQLLDLRYLRATAQKCSAKLKVLLEIKVSIHGFCALFIIRHGYWIFFVFDLIMLAWRSFTMYNTSEITDKYDNNKHIFYNLLDLFYHCICMCIYIVICVHQPLKDVTIDWIVPVFTDTLLYLYAISITYAMIYMLTDYIMHFVDIEFDEVDNRRIQKLLFKLNKSLPLKVLVHAALASALLSCGYWTSFCINLPILVYEVLQIARTYTEEDGPLTVYDPATNTVDTARASDQRKQSHMYLQFFLFVLYVTTISMVRMSGPALVIPVLLRYEILTVGAAILVMIPVISFILLIVCKKWPDDVDIKSFSQWLNALYLINILLHMLLCSFMFIHGSWFVLFLNLFLFYLEVNEVVNEEDLPYSAPELLSIEAIDLLIMVCRIHFLYFLFFFFHNLYCVYLINAEDMVLTRTSFTILIPALYEVVMGTSESVARTTRNIYNTIYSYLPFWMK